MEEKPFNDTSYEQFLNERKIMGSKCKKCGVLALPPRPICISCYGREMEWVQLKGTGKLAAFTSIVVAPPYMVKEGFNRNNPYIVGVVELEEGAKNSSSNHRVRCKETRANQSWHISQSRIS